MPVVINELEVVTERPRPNDPGGANAAPTGEVERQAARQMSPEVVRAIWRRDAERWLRSHAG